MVSKLEIDRVIGWCEERKKELNRIYITERNPFKDEIEWARRFPLVEIDRPKEVAAKTSLVYDSTTKQLWQFLNGNWRRIEAEMEGV
ncbi:MAG: hypothetical protein WCT31_01035 [Candidatus Micrarchaeia archaeon]|jgi:hypothetical protein